MDNFSAKQNFSIQGLCQTITSTDSSPYGNNAEGFLASDVTLKRWVFRNANGSIIKQYDGTAADTSCSCAISLLTLNITVELLIVIKDYTSYSVQNSFVIPCLGV